jgi:hypothetical protein
MDKKSRLESLISLVDSKLTSAANKEARSAIIDSVLQELLGTFQGTLEFLREGTEEVFTSFGEGS